MPIARGPQLSGAWGSPRGERAEGRGRDTAASVLPLRPQQPGRLSGGGDAGHSAGTDRELRLWARCVGKGPGPGSAERSGRRLHPVSRTAPAGPAYSAPLPRLTSPAPRSRAAAAAPSPRDPPLPGAERGGCPASPAAAAVTGRAGRTGLLWGGGGAARGPAASLRPGRGRPAASALYHHVQADSAAGKAARPAPAARAACCAGCRAGAASWCRPASELRSPRRSRATRPVRPVLGRRVRLRGVAARRP